MALNKKNKILTDKQYSYIFKNSRNYVTDYFIFKNMLADENTEKIIPPPYPKFGIIASKKVGNAVKRNRAKRIVSEALRLELESFRDNLIGVIICRDKILQKKSTEIQELFREMKFLYK